MPLQLDVEKTAPVMKEKPAPAPVISAEAPRVVEASAIQTNARTAALPAALPVPIEPLERAIDDMAARSLRRLGKCRPYLVFQKHIDPMRH